MEQNEVKPFQLCFIFSIFYHWHKFVMYYMGVNSESWTFPLELDKKFIFF